MRPAVIARSAPLRTEASTRRTWLRLKALFPKALFPKALFPKALCLTALVLATIGCGTDDSIDYVQFRKAYVEAAGAKTDRGVSPPTMTDLDIAGAIYGVCSSQKGGAIAGASSTAVAILRDVNSPWDSDELSAAIVAGVDAVGCPDLVEPPGY